MQGIPQLSCLTTYIFNITYFLSVAILSVLGPQGVSPTYPSVCFLNLYLSLSFVYFSLLRFDFVDCTSALREEYV